MGFSDELLKDSLLTEEFILDDLEDLKGYYDDMKVASRVVPALQDAPLPTLVAILDEDEQKRARVVTHSLLPLDEEEASFTKFLQFYCELQINLDNVERIKLLEAVVKLNQILPIGSCVLVDARPELQLPTMVALRSIQGYPIEDVIDQGAFCETLFLFDTACELTTVALDGLVAGKTVEEALAQLQGA